MASFFGKMMDYLLDDKKSVFDDIEKVVITNPKKNNFSSIASKASEGILQFPVIISNSIDYDTAVLVSKACERSYAGFVKTVFSMNADMSDTDSDNISDYLTTFHQNMGSSLDSDGSLRDMVESYTGSFPEKNEENIKMRFLEPNKKVMTSQDIEEMKPYVENFCLTKLNDLYQPRKISQVALESIVNPTRPAAQKVFVDSEVKKANELQPTFIELEVTRSSKDSDNKRSICYRINIGIKATLHMVNSAEYISNLVDACEYKGTLFRFIKWTTGEINFIRDFVLRMDLFKKETKNLAISKSHWWNALKKRAREAKISKVSDKRLLPNATFVISRSEVDYIKSNFGYDLMNDGIIKSIMKEYFLLGIVIVDTASELCHIRFDGQNKYQLLTFKALEREGGNVERQFKEMLRASKRM